MVYALNQNGWLAFNTCREKNLESYNLQKQAFLDNTQHQCFACCSKRVCQICIILVHCIECSSTFSLRPRELEMLKAWNNEDVPIYLFHARVNIQNCIGLRKKIPRARSYHFCKQFQCRSICFALKQWKKIDGSTVLFLKSYIPAAKQYMDFLQILPLKQTVWTHPSLTQSFNHTRESITKQLFYFQLGQKVRPKKSSKSLNSSFLSAASTKQPTSRNLTTLHPGWEI